MGHIVGFGARDFGQALLDCGQIVEPLKPGLAGISRWNNDNSIGGNDQAQ